MAFLSRAYTIVSRLAASPHSRYGVFRLKRPLPPVLPIIGCSLRRRQLVKVTERLTAASARGGEWGREGGGGGGGWRGTC